MIGTKVGLFLCLKKTFKDAHFRVEQATEDADTLIINTAINMSDLFTSVLVFGEYIDLLVILTALPKSTNIYFQKPAREKIPQKMYL